VAFALGATAGTIAVWAGSLVLDLVALVVCRVVLTGFEIHGFFTYALGAVGMELPALAWWLALALWKKQGVEPAGPSGFWGLFLGGIVAPVVLITYVPGLGVSEAISGLRIDGFWTYAAACAIAAAIQFLRRRSPPWVILRGSLGGAAAAEQAVY
jgi:hypothetical protein